MRKQGAVVLSPSGMITGDSSPRKLGQMGSQKCVKVCLVCGPILGTWAPGPVCGGCRQGHEATVPMEKLTCPGSVRGSGTPRSLLAPAQSVP